jgi:iron-sulfur cluster repair protein YtfE (RIC family)
VLKATDELLKDHRMIRKTLEGFRLDNPRFPAISKTLQRLLLGHAWFEDVIFLPPLKAEPLIARRFLDEISQEHKDLDALMALLRQTAMENKKELEACALQIRAILDTHFQKEEDALFPLAEKILREEGLDRLALEMCARQSEIHDVLPK